MVGNHSRNDLARLGSRRLIAMGGQVGGNATYFFRISVHGKVRLEITFLRQGISDNAVINSVADKIADIRRAICADFRQVNVIGDNRHRLIPDRFILDSTSRRIAHGIALGHIAFGNQRYAIGAQGYTWFILIIEIAALHIETRRGGRGRAVGDRTITGRLRSPIRKGCRRGAAVVNDVCDGIAA